MQVSTSPEFKKKPKSHPKRTSSTGSQSHCQNEIVFDLNTCLSNQFSKEAPMTPLINFNSISFNSQAQCGYCHGQKSSRLWVTSGFQCDQMSLNCYQQLMDRGWRRSGAFYFRPYISKSCCQAYTIRMDVNKHERRKLEQKAIKKVANLRAPSQQLQTIEEEPKDDETSQQLQKYLLQQNLNTKTPVQLIGKITSLKSIRIGNEDLLAKQFNPAIILLINKLLERIEEVISTYNEPNQQLKQIFTHMLQQLINNYQLYEIFPCRGSQKIDRIINANNYPYATNVISLFDANFQRRLKLEFGIQEIPYFQNKKLQSILKSILLEVMSEFKDITLNIRVKQPIIIMKNPPSDEMMNLKTHIYKFLNQPKPMNARVIQNIKKKNKVEQLEEVTIKWVRAKFEIDSFNVYQSYQKEIHKKEYVSEQSYRSFLCQQALQKWAKPPLSKDGVPLDCGCWHMKYYLANQLIAVGVIDVLPMSISSVYFFHEPKFRKYSLGIYGVVKEIEFMKEMQSKGHPFFQYYYLGYYIQDSQKMCYKGDYRLSELLCPVTYRWIPLDDDLRKQINKISEDSVKSAQDLQVELCHNNCQQIDSELEGVVFEDYIKENAKLFLGKNKTCRVAEIKNPYKDYFINVFKYQESQENL